MNLDALHRSLGIPAEYARTRRLRPQLEADENDLIVIATTEPGKKIQLIASAASAWHRMRAIAEKDGVVLVPISGFRSIARQTEIIRAKLAAGAPIEAILSTIAAPGFSEHHTGRAIDVSTPGEPALEESFARTLAFAWLDRRAREFGFYLSYGRNNPHGIGFEPWHWCWRP